MSSTIKLPSAWVPIVLSLVMLAIMIMFFVVSGPPVPEADEGVGAYLFQLWLVLEVFMIVFFAFKWLSQRPKQTFLILAIQIIAVLVVCAPVFLLHL